MVHKLKNLLTKQNWRAETNNLEISKNLYKLQNRGINLKILPVQTASFGGGTLPRKVFGGVDPFFKKGPQKPQKFFRRKSPTSYFKVKSTSKTVPFWTYLPSLLLAVVWRPEG